jgi:hypothetical protein
MCTVQCNAGSSLMDNTAYLRQVLKAVIFPFYDCHERQIRGLEGEGRMVSITTIQS